MRRGTRLAAAALALGLLPGMTGCSALGPRDRMVVLPTPEPALVVEEEAGGEAFTVRSTDQFAYRTACSTDGNGFSTPIAFSQGDLYIVYGGPDEPVTLKRVDPRYGFYEEIADLGVLDYEKIGLSPDGRYLLYSQTDRSTETLRLTLVDVGTGEMRCVLQCPRVSTLLTLDFCFSGDGEHFFCWMTYNGSGVSWKEDMEWYGSIQTTLPFPEDVPLNEVLRGDCDAGEAETWIVLEEMEATEAYAMEQVGDPGNAYNKSVVISPDGERAAVSYFSPVLGNVCAFFSGGAEDTAASELYSNLLRNGGEIFQITEDAVLGACFRGDTYQPFLGRGSGVVYWTELADANLRTLRLSPDGLYALSVEYGADGECLVCVYPLDAARQPRRSGRRVLYQSLQSYADLWIAPEQDRVILLSHNYTVEEDVLEKGEAEAVLATEAAYTVTVLEM